MSASAALLAAVMLQTQGGAAQAAEAFAQACLATGGVRAAVADVAVGHGWALSDLGGSVPGADWADGYAMASGFAALYQTPAKTLSGPVGATISGPALTHCQVTTNAPLDQWRDAAGVLDASEKLMVFPEELQPRDGAGRNGLLRAYAMQPGGPGSGSVTISHDVARGLLTIKMMRPVATAPQDP
ncbi:hypothetical protein [Brevundimonas sp. Root1279]|uniref:hypothetical protein n=1 Tax=Brevundimonas sp. Root1279 TaxID=1736443 RepID=UPI0006FAC113|nr:hypothetical protein [Brevundimonas sp. Root1279]KQW81901.1 hypothetical protein ASC65_11485 [Brevundimonas sp. Root1279]